MINIDRGEADRLLAAARHLIRALEPIITKPLVDEATGEAIDNIVNTVAREFPHYRTRALHRHVLARLGQFNLPIIGEREMARRLLRLGFTKQLKSTGTFWVAPNAVAPSPATETT